MILKTLKMNETLAYGYSSDSTQRELSNEYQHDGFQKSVHPCALDESSLSIGRVKKIYKSYNLYNMLLVANFANTE